MPIYQCTVSGSTKPRLVKADTAAQAKSFLVDVKAVTAEELSDLIEGGATIEKAPPATTSSDGKSEE